MRGKQRSCDLVELAGRDPRPRRPLERIQSHSRDLPRVAEPVPICTRFNRHRSMINSVVPACPVRSEPRMSTRVLCRRPSRIALIVAAALPLCKLLGEAQQSPAQDQPRPTFRTEANYIRVDVYATTRDGMPVTDLRR